MVLDMTIFFPIKCLLNSRNDMVGIIYRSHKVTKCLINYLISTIYFGFKIRWYFAFILNSMFLDLLSTCSWIMFFSASLSFGYAEKNNCDLVFICHQETQ